MRCLDRYPLITTAQVAQCRDFYTRYLGFRVAFEASWIAVLAGEGETPATIGFMLPGHPSSPPGPQAFLGQGFIFTLQVEDAAAEASRVAERGLRPDLPLRDEPWGQRRFGVYDPAGVWIDVVQQIEPAAGWWDRYLAS